MDDTSVSASVMSNERHREGWGKRLTMTPAREWVGWAGSIARWAMAEEEGSDLLVKSTQVAKF